MSCNPSYAGTYQPDFTPGTNKSPDAAQDCSATTYVEWRSRLYAGGTFFRSKLPGREANLIELQLVDSVGGGPSPGRYILYIYFNGTFVERIPTTGDIFQGNPPVIGEPCDPNGITQLRTAVNGASSGSGWTSNGSNWIEMPDCDSGGPVSNTFQSGFSSSVPPGDDANCLSAFGRTFMSGADGPPIALGSPQLGSPVNGNVTRTGPERDIIIIRTTEYRNGLTDVGDPLEPDITRKVQQFNGSTWISYANIIQGECPFDGTLPGSPAGNFICDVVPSGSCPSFPVTTCP